MQLRYHNTLCAIEYERTTIGHIGDSTEIHILNYNAEILVLVVSTIELKLRLQRHTIGQTALQTLLDRVTGRIDIVVDELKYEIIAGIGDGEILLEHFVEALGLSILGRSVHLEEIAE